MKKVKIGNNRHLREIKSDRLSEREKPQNEKIVVVLPVLIECIQEENILHLFT